MMNIRSWTEAIGLLGVVVSMALLTWQLYQANSVARFTAGTEVKRQYNEINLQGAIDPALGKLVTALHDEDVTLSEAQRAQTIFLASWLYNSWSTAELAFREGWVSRSGFQTTLNDVQYWLKVPGFAPVLREAVARLTANRPITEVEELILKGTDDTSAGPAR